MKFCTGRATQPQLTYAGRSPPHLSPDLMHNTSQHIRWKDLQMFDKSAKDSTKRQLTRFFHPARTPHLFCSTRTLFQRPLGHSQQLSEHNTMIAIKCWICLCQEKITLTWIPSTCQVITTADFESGQGHHESLLKTSKYKNSHTICLAFACVFT